MICEQHTPELIPMDVIKFVVMRDLNDGNQQAHGLIGNYCYSYPIIKKKKKKSTDFFIFLIYFYVVNHLLFLVHLPNYNNLWCIILL